MIVGFRVSVGEATDLIRVIALERATAEAPHWTEAEYAAAVEEEEGAVRRCLLVAESERGLLGFAVGKVLVRARLGEIESVAVDADSRRSGVGKALCEAVVAWCKGQGAVEVELEVREGSAGAIALYEGLGFVPVGRRVEYYRDPLEDALLMRLKLAGGD